MRKDYVEPDDFEYEPTPHDEVLKRAQEHQSRRTGNANHGTGAGRRMSVAETKLGKARRLEPPAGDRAGRRGRAARSRHGAASSLDARRLPHGRGARRRARHPPQAGLRLSAPQSRKDRREAQSYLASMPYTDRLDYFCSLTNNWAYALAVEKLVGQEVPERAEYIRVILAELTRIQNHAVVHRLSHSGDGRQRHAADVRLQRARKDSRPLRIAHRLAHDVQLHALRRLPRGCFRGRGSTPRAKWLPACPQFVDEFEALLSIERNSDGALPGRGHSASRSWPSMPESPGPCCARRA